MDFTPNNKTSVFELNVTEESSISEILGEYMQRFAKDGVVSNREDIFNRLMQKSVSGEIGFYISTFDQTEIKDLPSIEAFEMLRHDKFWSIENDEQIRVYWIRT